MNPTSSAWNRMAARLHRPASRPASRNGRRDLADDAAPTAVPPDAVASLAAQVAGPVFTPGDDGYDHERAGYNLVVDDRPAVIVGATGAADVMAAVSFATDQGLPVAVRCSGHTAAVPADGALLISTRRMRGVRVDPQAGVAAVQAGTRLSEVIHEAAAFGLAPLAGSSPSVGVAGYVLGGGLPLLGRAFGYAADHVRSIDVVTPHGILRRVTEDHYADLFWALRGGKGNFGVVTSLDIGLVQVRRLYGGGLWFRGSSAPAVLHRYRRWVRTVPERMASSVALNRFGWQEGVPDHLRGRFVVHIRIAFAGDAAEGETLVRPLREAARPIADTITEMPYRDSGTIHADPPGPIALAEHSTLLRDLDEDAVDMLLDLTGPDSTCPLNFVEVRHLGGALARQPAPPNAVGGRDAAFLLYAARSGPAGAPLDEARDYARMLAATWMAPWSTGQVPVNFLGADDSADAVRAGYDPDAYQRLVMIKRNYDPENMFRVNHNIPPARQVVLSGQP